MAILCQGTVETAEHRGGGKGGVEGELQGRGNGGGAGGGGCWEEPCCFECLKQFGIIVC